MENKLNLPPGVAAHQKAAAEQLAKLTGQKIEVVKEQQIAPPKILNPLDLARNPTRSRGR